MDQWTDRMAHADINEHLKTPSGLISTGLPKDFVPLCGKSLDMGWLNEQGASVVGVDLVRQPLEQYFDEQMLTPQQSNR